MCSQARRPDVEKYVQEIERRDKAYMGEWMVGVAEILTKKLISAQRPEGREESVSINWQRRGWEWRAFLSEERGAAKTLG